jgi:hypothetical protein
MNTKHSSTHWKIQPLGPRPGYPNWKAFCIRDAKTNVHIATVGNVDRYFEGKEEANAILIASAPTQHSALTEIDRLTCNMPVMDIDTQEGFRLRPSLEAYRIEVNKVIIQIRETARAAIAQATGGAA